MLKQNEKFESLHWCAPNCCPSRTRSSSSLTKTVFHARRRFDSVTDEFRRAEQQLSGEISNSRPVRPPPAMSCAPPTPCLLSTRSPPCSPLYCLRSAPGVPFRRRWCSVDLSSLARAGERPGRRKTGPALAATAEAAAPQGGVRLAVLRLQRGPDFLPRPPVRQPVRCRGNYLSSHQVGSV